MEVSDKRPIGSKCTGKFITRARPLAARVINDGQPFFFGVASVTFHQRIAGSIIQDGRRLRSGRQAICIITRARPLAARVLKWVSLLSVVDCRQCHKQAP